MYSLFRLYHTRRESEILNFALSSSTIIFSDTENGLLPSKLHKCNICFLTRACMNLVKHFKNKRDFRLVWRYVCDWQIGAPACCVVILFYQTVMNISLPCRLHCAQSRLKWRVESYRKLVASPSDHHHISNSVQCQSYLRYGQPHVRHHSLAWLQEEARCRWWTAFTSKVLIPHVRVGLTILSYQLIWKVTEDKVDTQRQIRFGHAEKMSFSQSGP